MGAWGHGPLENDGASDFVYGITDKKSRKAAIKEIKQVAKRVKKHVEIDASDGETLLAAAALIGLQRGQPVAEWAGQMPPLSIEPFPPKIVAMVRTLALRAVNDPGSELRELWQDSGEFEDWVAASTRAVEAIG